MPQALPENERSAALPAVADATDVAYSYRLFLRREAESAEVIGHRVGLSGEAIIRPVLSCDEFRVDFIEALCEGDDSPSPGLQVDVPFRCWAARFFRFDSASRRLLISIDDSTELLALALMQPALADLADRSLGDGMAARVATAARRSVARRLRGFTTMEDMVNCHELLLGRSPEAEFPLADWADQPLATTIALFLTSREFTDRVATPALRGRFEFSDEATPHLAAWAQRAVRLTKDSPPVPRLLLAAVLRAPAVRASLATRPPAWDPEELAGALDQAIAKKPDTGFRPLEPVLAAEFSLLAGVPFERADFGSSIQAVALDTRGAPRSRGLSADNRRWVAFAPSGSLAAPDFARQLLATASARPEAMVFYGDDIARVSAHSDDRLRLKPAFDPMLLAAQDYVGAPVIVRADALARLGGVDPARGSAALVDLLFRAHTAGLSISRIPSVLLAHAGERVRAELDEHRAAVRAQPWLVNYVIKAGRTLRSLALWRDFTDSDAPPVAILIPTVGADGVDCATRHLSRLLDSLACVDWPMERLTVIVGDDAADPGRWARADRPYALRRIPTPRRPGDRFNYAAKMNLLWKAADCEQLVMLNDDVLPTDPSWLRALLTFATMPDVGGVGARLLYPDGTLQHAGMAAAGQEAKHLWSHRPGAADTYQDWALVHRQWSMVTGAVFATRRRLLARLGGFDERFSLEFNDTDLCLRMVAAGYRVVFTPHAEMIHIEKASRGQALPPMDERAIFERRWRAALSDDPAWHPNMSRDLTNPKPLPDPLDWYR